MDNKFLLVGIVVLLIPLANVIANIESVDSYVMSMIALLGLEPFTQQALYHLSYEDL